MKKLLTILFITILFISCNQYANFPIVEKIDGENKIVMIDGCEYIEHGDSEFSNNYSLCHKGNCKNPCHLYTNETQIQLKKDLKITRDSLIKSWQRETDYLRNLTK